MKWLPGARVLTAEERRRWVHDDGGRAAAGRRGTTGDCVCRAAAIATGRPYAEVYDLINEMALGERYRRGRVGRLAATGRRSSARTGVMKDTTRELMARLGGVWTPTMKVGQGCRVHLRAEELPAGRLVVAVSRHLCAVIDGVVHDIFDPSRGGTRCVYGYWAFGAPYNSADASPVAPSDSDAHRDADR